MMILAPNGKPVKSVRSVTLSVQIRDSKPGQTGTELSSMNFVLDVPDRRLVGQLLEQIKTATQRRLDAIGFYEQAAPVAGGSIGSEQVDSDAVG